MTSSATQSLSRVVMVSMALFFVSLFLTAYSARNPGLAAAGSALVAEGLRPLQSLLRAGSSTASELWNGYLALIDTEKENLFLKERLAALEVENSRLGEWEGEITRLREMVNVSQERGFQGLAADVIGYDSTNWVRAITVSRGSEDGVRIGMPVIQGNAVVGQVIAAGPRSARVLLITDHSSGIDGLVQSSRVRGTVEGSGSGDCQLNYVLSDEDVSVGDRVITSGMDGIYPKGLLIGIISSVEKRRAGMFQELKVKPSVPFAKLETVMIITEASGSAVEVSAKVKVGSKDTATQ